MKNSDVLIITPPLTQLNAPYPAAPYLIAFLKEKSFEAAQYDLSIELIDNVFSKDFLSKVFEKNQKVKNGKLFIQNIAEYLHLIEPVKDFLRGNNQSLANRICKRNFLPEGPRFKQINDLEWWFGSIGKTDLARHLATLFLLDIADFIRQNECPYFEMTKYAEKLAISLPTFDPIEKTLNEDLNLIDKLIVDLLELKLKELNPKVVAFTIPFPGNLYSALRCCQYLKLNHPLIKTAIGGGYVSTELRVLSDPAIFKYVDFIVLDDGELPLLRLLEYLKDKRTPLLRTLIKNGDEVQLINPSDENVLVSELSTPDFTGIDTKKYLSLMELPNPMQSLWSNGFWNKMQLARGCYWAKCTFCDTTLPYISHFDSNDAVRIVDGIEKISGQTGETGFHFVDEAAPPNLLRRISEEIIKRNLVITWWTNIRFEKNFTDDLCKLMSKAGCIAVTGGIEVASNRILQLINKGVTVEQAALTCKNFRDSGIMVHAYLMYGFPSETEQETIDSLEVVRQFFKQNLIQSGFWHRFAMTCHSPTGKKPQDFGAQRLTFKPNPFANNEVQFIENVKINHSKFGKGLEKAIYNYIQGIGVENHVNYWFDFKIPLPTVEPDFVGNMIGESGKNKREK